ncbi:hypothetical protein HELRODRAFT_66185 [Helobdella robusta]|uniref:Mitochondrial import inner membrane translocase subunit TIM44 n=1 Tax=Helobdella robusta TaxID=6412 RepID=T1FYI2_HELRO|nr:hypothetical protein HELRODRAFT_66185 [Helobdella robusta]ESO01933.1 hypothetical protein HELRODRAFT_66185 [Helobdella robusta]
MSTRRNFISEFIENIKHELNKNKEMKDSLKKFREEAEKLEQSDSLKKAREKYQSIEAETVKSSDALKKKISEMVKEKLSDVEKSEYAKKGKEIVDDVAQSMGRAADTVSRQTEQLAKSQVFKTVSSGVKTLKEEIKESTTYERSTLYKAPEKLRKREEYMVKPGEEKPIEANFDASGVVLHKDSQWYQSWQLFKDNNQLVNKLFDMKTRYDESGNVLIRATRTVTDKLSELFGGIFTKTEMSTVLTEIIRMDPTFDKEQFIKLCQFDFIPNILEAIVQGNLEILQDWCHEGAFNILATPIRQAQAANYKFDSKVLDVNHVDIVAGKIMDQGPVLVISFTAQQIMVVRDLMNNVVEGDPEKIMRIFYVWAFCRDQNVLDPRAAWKLIDLSASPMEQWL